MDSFDRQWQRWFPEDRGKKLESPVGFGRKASRILLVLAGVFTLFIILNIAKGLYAEWLWFNSLNYGSVYTTVLKT